MRNPETDTIKFRVINGNTLANILYMAIEYQVEIQKDTVDGFIKPKYVDTFLKCFNCVNNIESGYFPLNVYREVVSNSHYKFYGNGYCIFELIGNNILFEKWKINCYMKYKQK